jgi:hypothetical protein
LWIWAIALGLALASLPSLKIARFMRVAPPVAVPSKAGAGTPLTVSDAAGAIESVELGGRPLSRIKGRGLFLGAIGLNERGELPLAGLLRYRPRPMQDGPIGWVYASPIFVFAGTIQVEAAGEAPLRAPSAIAPAEAPEREDGEFEASCWLAPSSAEGNGMVRAPAPGEAVLPAAAAAPSPAPKAATASGAASAGVKTLLIYHGGGVYSRLGPLRELVARGGERLAAGQVVGYAGSGDRGDRAPLARWDVLWKGKPVNAVAFLDLSRQLCAAPADQALSPGPARLADPRPAPLAAPPLLDTRRRRGGSR